MNMMYDTQKAKTEQILVWYDLLQVCSFSVAQGC